MGLYRIRKVRVAQDAADINALIHAKHFFLSEQGSDKDYILGIKLNYPRLY